MSWIEASAAPGQKCMKNLRDKFSDEEKRHLNYLGSMLGRPNTPEEQELEDVLEAIEKARTKASLRESTERENQPSREKARCD
jgi:hypothetical protein